MKKLIRTNKQSDFDSIAQGTIVTVDTENGWTFTSKEFEGFSHDTSCYEPVREEPNIVFKEGDRVYCGFVKSWGTVCKAEPSLTVEFDEGFTHFYSKEGRLANKCIRTLSFTEYTLEMWGFSQDRPKTYSVGDRFVDRDNDEYILASPYAGEYKVCLISLLSGSIPTSPVLVKCLTEITEEEIKPLLVGRFTKKELI